MITNVAILETLSKAVVITFSLSQELRKTVYMICKSDEDDRRPVIIRAPKYRDKGNSHDTPSIRHSQYSASPIDMAERERLAILEKEHRDMKDQMTELRHLTELQQQRQQQQRQQQQQTSSTPGDTFYIGSARNTDRPRGLSSTPHQQLNSSQRYTPESISSGKSILSSGQSSRQFGLGHSQRQVSMFYISVGWTGQGYCIY
jgi:TolA-binding protein